MKRQLIVGILILVAHFSICDATLIPSGSEVRSIGQTPMILDSPHFLLTRTDMEAAVLAQETVEIQKEAIGKYEKALAKSNKQLLLAKRLLIVLPFAGVIAGAVLDFAIRTNFFTK